MSDDQPRDETLVDRPADTDQRLWSVTTIIGASSSKDALINWAAKETARAAVSSLKSVQAIIADDGPDAAVEWLKGARYRARQGQRTATELGTAVHAACERYALTGQRPQVDDEIRPFLDRFEDWCQQFQPAYEAAEMTVYSPTYGYAGTMDAIVKVDGLAAVTDYKTSRDDLDDKGKPKGPWPDVALQLAAYRYADFAGPWPTRRYEYFRRRYYLLGPDEQADAVPIPEVDGGLCLYITPQRCEAYPVRCDEPIFEAFLYAVERARWSLETQRTVLGPAIPAPQATHA
jgi:hypothetical protein